MFTYKWDTVNLLEKSISLFNCYTPKGTVEGNKLTEAIFSFIPNELGTFEKFYQFVIERYELSTTFLMVGNAREPCVFFTSPHIMMKNTIMGIEVSEIVYLRNNETFDLNYRFKKYTMYCEGRQQKLDVRPSSGAIGANNEIQIW